MKINTGYNSWLGSKCGFGGDAKFCTVIAVLVVAKQDSISFVRTCAKPRNVNARDSLSRTPLHWAYRGVHFEVLKYLVEQGADINARDINSITPLTNVTARNHLESVRYLLALCLTFWQN